jgi:nitroreductase
MTVDEAITSRRAVRAFLPTPVSLQTVTDILNVAARAPSGTNMQPWRVHVLAGAEKQRLSARLLEQFNSGAPAPEQEYRYYPENFFEPYLSRRRKVGWDLYGLLGIGRADREKMHAQHSRNVLFFDAPIGMICTIDRRLAIGSWLDYGMFLQNIALAARGRGLDTCMQAAFAPFHALIRDVLDLPEEELVVCGLALGMADPDAPENRLVTERVPASEFATFRGFDE